MTRLEESIAVDHCLLADAQSAVFTVDGERDEYHRRLGVEEQQCGSSEGLLRGLRSQLVDHDS